MLLTGLQGHTITQLSVFVFWPANDTSRNVTLVLVTCSKITGRRSTVEHWCAETLRSTEYNVSSPFSRRCEQGKTQNIGGYSHFLYKGAVIFHISTCIGILQYAGKNVRRHFHLGIFTCAYLDTLRDGACGHYCQYLWKNLFVHKHNVCTGFLHIARTQGIHHTDGFGRSCCFIQQGTVGKRHTC